MSIDQYKIGTTVAIEKSIVIDYFKEFFSNDVVSEDDQVYRLKDGSVLLLKTSSTPGKYYVHFQMNYVIVFPPEERYGFIDFENKNLILTFFIKTGSQIQNLRTKMIMPASDGALMSDIFTSKSFRLALHRANHPKDI